MKFCIVIYNKEKLDLDNKNKDQFQFPAKKKMMKNQMNLKLIFHHSKRI